ncbi:cyclin-P [Synchiropus picturatus]
MNMARTGVCDSKPLLDLHMKAEERRAPFRAWANTCGPLDHWQPVDMEESRMGLIKMESEHKWERKFPGRAADGRIVGLHEDGLTVGGGTKDGCVEQTVLLPGFDSLLSLMPSLLRHEVETTLQKLDLILDRTYAWEMFLDMMKSQGRSCFPNADLPRHFTDSTRAVLVDWLMQVHEIMNFQDDTLYLSIHLLNRALRQVKVSTANLQLLGMVCLFIAAKKEESLLPEVSGLCYLMDHTYTKHQLLRMERKVLCGLKFDLSYCSPLHFLHILASLARCSAKVVWMARYLLQLSLLENQCVVVLPVHLAGAALCLARQVVQEPPTPEGEAAWCLASSIHVGSEATLLRIMHVLASAAAKAKTREMSATFNKFSSPDTMQVSRHPGLDDISALLTL